MAVLPGKTLERYELLNRIAVGGMAEVYRAVAYGAHGFEKTLAIKRILPELARDPEFEARFIEEAKLAVQLTHANVVQVFDFGRFAGTLFIAMEYVDGLDLAALLKHNRERGERVPIPAAFQMAIEIVRGLDFAHQHRVVHRDVSPSNILLSRAGEVKIADFGIAQAATERVSRPSGRRKIMGKWRYMSPEQTQGDDLSTRSDIFSAASVLFELFTGDKLFEGDEAEKIIQRIHEMEIPSASDRRPGLPPRLDDVLRRCLQRDPEDRPGKPGEVVRALTEISYESSIVATALDVAEVVNEALPSVAPEPKAAEAGGEGEGEGGGIDALIRKQLSGAAPPPVAGSGRRTAVGTQVEGTEAEDAEPTEARVDAPEGLEPPRTHTATVIKKGVDADGLTVWEVVDDDGEASEDTIAAVPSAIRLGKSTGSNRAIQEEEAEKAAEVPPSKLPWIGLVALLLAGGAAAVFALGGGDDDGTAAGAVVTDAAAPAATVFDAAPEAATLELGSNPPGARVWVDGDPVAERTPTELEVEPGEHEIAMLARGHARWSLTTTVQAGERLKINPTLVAIRASLVARTTPEGAQVFLRGEPIGATPLELTDLEPGRGLELVIRKKGFQMERRTVDLVAGETATLEETLERQVVYGTIRIALQGWANVIYRGKKIATVPRQPVRLPVGKHTLELVNPPTGKKKTIDVEVAADEVEIYQVSW